MAIEVDVIAGLLVFLGFTAFSFVFTWFISKLFFTDNYESKKGKYGKDTEPEFTADDFMGVIVVNFFGVTLELVFFIPRLAVRVGDIITKTIPDTPRYSFILIGACVATGLVVYQPQLIKSYWGMDQIILRPIIDNLVNQLLNIVRLFANIVLPAWNFVWRMIYVANYEVPKVLFTCEMQNWRATAEAAAYLIRNFTTDLRSWSQNNPMNTRVNFINTFRNLGPLTNSTSGTVICFAEDLYPFYAAFVDTASSTYMVEFLDHAANVPFSVLRVVFRPLQERGGIPLSFEPLIVELQATIFFAGKVAETIVLDLFVAWWGITTDPGQDPPLYIIQRFFQSPWSEPITGVANAALGLVNTTTTAFLNPLQTFSANAGPYIQTESIFIWLVRASDALGEVVQSVFFEIQDVNKAVASLAKTIVYLAESIIDVIVQYLFTFIFIHPEDPFVFFSEYLDNSNAALNLAFDELNTTAKYTGIAISQVNEPLGCTVEALSLAVVSLTNSTLFTVANIENILTGQDYLDQYVDLPYLFGDITLGDPVDGVLSEMLPRCLGDVARQFTPNPPCERLVERDGSIIETTEFTDIFCASGNTIEYGSRAIIVIIGEAFRVAVELLSGAVFSSLSSIAPRLRYALSNAKAGVCQLLTTVAAVIPETVTCVSATSSCGQIRSCLANFLCSLTNILFVPLDVLVQFIEDLVDSFEHVGSPWKNTAALFAYVIMSVVTAVTEAMRQFGNLIWCGTGIQTVSNVINDIADALDEIAEIITEAVIEIFKTLILLITSLTNPGAFFDHLTSLFLSLAKLLINGLTNVIEQIIIKLFTALGMSAIGDFLAAIIGDLCYALQGVLDIVVGALKVLTLGLDNNIKFVKLCCGGPGAGGQCKPQQTSSQGSSAAGQGTRVPGTGRSLLSIGTDEPMNAPHVVKTFVTQDGLTLSQYSNGSAILQLDDSDFMKYINTWNWTGISECDIFVSGSKDVNISSMTPLEKGFLTRCVTDRAIGMILHEKLPFIHPDILTNRWRKWMILADIAKSSPLIAMYTMERMLPWEVVSSPQYVDGWKKAGYSVSHLQDKQAFNKAIGQMTLEDYFARNKMLESYAPSQFVMDTLSKTYEIVHETSMKAINEMDAIFDSEVMKRFDEKGQYNKDYDPLKVAFTYFMSSLSKLKKAAGVFWRRISTTETTASQVLDSAKISINATLQGGKWLYANFGNLNFGEVKFPTKEFANGVGNIIVEKVVNITSSIIKPQTEQAKKNRQVIWSIVDGLAGSLTNGLKYSKRPTPTSQAVTTFSTGRSLNQAPSPGAGEPFFSLDCCSGSDYLCHKLYILDQVVCAITLQWNQTIYDFDTRFPVYVDEFEDFANYSSNPSARVRIGNSLAFVPFYFPNKDFGLEYYLGGFGNSSFFAEFDFGIGEGPERGLVTKAVRENAGNITANPLVSTIYWLEYFSQKNISGPIDNVANSVLISDPAAERGPGGRVFGLIEGFILCDWQNATQCFNRRGSFGEGLAWTLVIYLGAFTLIAAVSPTAVTLASVPIIVLTFLPVFLYITYGRGVLCALAMPECIIQDASNFLFYTILPKCPWLISGMAKDPGTLDTCYGRIPEEIWNCMTERHFYTIFDNLMYDVAVYAPGILEFIETTRSPLTNLRRLPYFGGSIDYFYNVSLHLNDSETYTSHGSCNGYTTLPMTVSASGVALIIQLASPILADAIQTLLYFGIIFISNCLFFVCFTFLQIQVQYVHRVPIRYGKEYLDKAPRFR